MRLRRLVGASALVAAVVVPPATAVAQDYVDYVDYVGARSPELERTNADPDVSVLGTTTTRDSMPITGGDLFGLALIGAGAVGVGTVFVRRSRTRGTTA